MEKKKSSTPISKVVFQGDAKKKESKKHVIT